MSEMEKAEYQDHPDKLMGWQEFKDMGKGEGQPIPPKWLLQRREHADDQQEASA